MIISPKQRNSSTLAKLLGWTRPSRTRQAEKLVLAEGDFCFEIQKERSRVDRRIADSKFSVIIVHGIGLKQLGAKPELVLAIRDRLRITDTIGWSDNRLTILLPETVRDGAELVADQITDIGSFHDLDVNCEVFVYPDDYSVAQQSSEFQTIDFQKPGGDGLDSAKTIAFSALNLEEEKSLPFVTERTPLWKRMIDIIGSSAGLILLSPVFAGAAVAIKLSSRGPVFFRQKREGIGGEIFEILKFRTMCTEAESLKGRLREFSEQDGPAFKLENDPRLTKVGKYLRKSCIDELPQLINVLRGERSLVGPRPLPVDESYECSIWQRKRLEVTPGLTCIWQVKGDRNTKFSDWMRMDMEYIRRRSLLFDLKLIVETIFVALLHRGSV